MVVKGLRAGHLGRRAAQCAGSAAWRAQLPSDISGWVSQARTCRFRTGVGASSKRAYSLPIDRTDRQQLGGYSRELGWFAGAYDVSLRRL